MQIDKEASDLMSNLYRDVHDIQVHVEVLNHEGSEMRDEQKKMNVTLNDLAIQHAAMKTDTEWLKTMTWFISTTSVLTLIGMVVEYIMKK